MSYYIEMWMDRAAIIVFGPVWLLINLLFDIIYGPQGRVVSAWEGLVQNWREGWDVD